MLLRHARLSLLAATLAAAGPVVVGASAPAVAGAGAVCASADAAHHVAVVVTHLDGSTIAPVCVAFSMAQITAKDALASSGIEYGLSPDPNYGDALCQVDSEPATYPPNCLSSPNYWSLWQSGYNQSWSYANKGIDGVVLYDGDSVGFRYVPDANPSPPGSPRDPCPAPLPISPAPTGATPPAPAPTAGGGGSGSATAAGRAGGSPSSRAVPGTSPASGNAAGTQALAPATSGSLATAPSRRGGQRSAGAATAGHSSPAAPPGAAGWFAALVAAAVLGGMLVMQVILPRLRR